MTPFDARLLPPVLRAAWDGDANIRRKVAGALRHSTKLRTAQDVADYVAHLVRSRDAAHTYNAQQGRRFAAMETAGWGRRTPR